MYITTYTVNIAIVKKRQKKKTMCMYGCGNTSTSGFSWSAASTSQIGRHYIIPTSMDLSFFPLSTFKHTRYQQYSSTVSKPPLFVPVLSLMHAECWPSWTTHPVCLWKIVGQVMLTLHWVGSSLLDDPQVWSFMMKWAEGLIEFPQLIDLMTETFSRQYVLDEWKQLQWLKKVSQCLHVFH